MKNCFQHPLRLLFRLSWLGGEFCLAAVSWLATVRDEPSRARWLHRSAQRVARVFPLRLRIEGVPPAYGFLVANHLSYLDILVLAACQPCVFVAKRDVRSWPVLGLFARMAGTIFVNRQSRMEVVRTGGEMRRAADNGTLVVLFPEGTSSGGGQVLPFKSSLLAPLAPENLVAVAHLKYTLRRGDASREICYWGDMTLFPHLLNALTTEDISATVRFGAVSAAGLARKALAVRLRDEVLALGNDADESPDPPVERAQPPWFSSPSAPQLVNASPGSIPHA